MKMNEINLVLKVTGTKDNIKELIDHLEKQYYIVFASAYQDNSEGEGFHRYLTLIDKNLVKKEANQ